MKVYLGLVGCYRTFLETSNNLFTNLIDCNPECSFDIYINTEYINKYTHDKWNIKVYKDLIKNHKKYTKEELDILFKKCYKSNLKKITYWSVEKTGSPFNKRVENSIDEYNNENENEKYDLYFFMRIDSIFLKKLNLYDYANKLDKNMVKLICRDMIHSNRFDHNRDWDMGYVSKNINNIYKLSLWNVNILTPDDNELKKLAQEINCINIYSIYDIPLPEKIEKRYRNNWTYDVNCYFYSFNKQICPLLFEDEFFLSILY